MGINKYAKIKKIFIALVTVVTVINLILFKGGDTSLNNALAETMGPHQGQFLFFTRIIFIVTVFVLFPLFMVFEVLDKKRAGKPYKKIMSDNIAVVVFIIAVALLALYNGL